MVNPNAFSYTMIGNYQYDGSASKCIIIRNPCIGVTQRVFASGLFARKDSLSLPHLPELYFLHNMLQLTCVDPRSFFANQLLSITTSSAKKIMIGGLITPTSRSVGIEPNTDDRMSRSKRLKLAVFELMKFYTVDGGRMCWIYCGTRLIPLPNVD